MSDIQKLSAVVVHAAYGSIPQLFNMALNILPSVYHLPALQMYMPKHCVLVETKNALSVLAGRYVCCAHFRFWAAMTIANFHNTSGL